MGFFNWSETNREVSRFARTLAQDLAKRYPPAMDNSGAKRVSANRLTKILEEIYAKARQFHEENSLGMYRKAKLGNTFRWELQEMGYTKEFVELATEGLIVYLTRR